MSYLFYANRPGLVAPSDTVSLIAGYLPVLWKPRVNDLVPDGTSRMPFAAWWLCHYGRVFSNRDYALQLIYDNERVIHRSGVFPRYFRFPFMAADDLQIGDTWTEPEYRGQGLATFAIQEIVKALQKPNRTFWYVVEQDNRSSIRAVEKAGFEIVGEGARTKRFGTRALGAYVVQQSVTPPVKR